MVLTRSQTRARQEQQSNASTRQSRTSSSTSQQSRRRRTTQSTSSRRTEPNKRRAARGRKRRREHDEDSETKQPEKKQRCMDKEDRSALGMAVLSELICPVCTEIVTGPVTLKCGHSFCYICICKHIDARYPNTLCPLCRDRLETTYEPKVSILFQNAIQQMLSSCLFEDTMETKSYQSRQAEYLAFKVDREQNPPDRQPCQCPSCRRNRGEGSPAFDMYRFGMGEEDEETDDEISPPVRQRPSIFDSFDIMDPAEAFFRSVVAANRPFSDSISSDEVSVGLNNRPSNNANNGNRSNENRNSNGRQQPANRRQNNNDDNENEQEAGESRYPFRRTAARRARA